ncbi:hypothetical protein FHS72_002704 [Loktanella ponticola]|uniref:Uncharacterized protein n=1 Tax=Yoonia ponticola TaxID=1524255 RepID=A0A7W9EYQ7_9RHOB|nr:hypothetical protein [Yoonia ponticola]
MNTPENNGKYDVLTFCPRTYPQVSWMPLDLSCPLDHCSATKNHGSVTDE